MRLCAAVLIMGLTAVAHADSYTLVNFDDMPPTYVSTGHPPDTTAQGADPVTLVYPQITIGGGILVADGVSYFDLEGGFDPSTVSPPYSNSYQAMDFGQSTNSPSESIGMYMPTPVKEVDFDFFESNFVSPFTWIEVSDSSGQEVYQCDTYYMVFKNISGHFDCLANDIQSVTIYGSEPGYYFGIDNVELNAYLNTPSPVPEPPAYLLLVTGLLSLGALGLRVRLSIR